MGAIMCGGTPTAGDRESVDQFAASLARGVGRSPMEAFFDGDVHLVAGKVVNRNDYVIVDGRLEVAR